MLRRFPSSFEFCITCPVFPSWFNLLLHVLLPLPYLTFLPFPYLTCPFSRPLSYLPSYVLPPLPYLSFPPPCPYPLFYLLRGAISREEDKLGGAEEPVMVSGWFIKSSWELWRPRKRGARRGYLVEDGVRGCCKPAWKWKDHGHRPEDWTRGTEQLEKLLRDEHMIGEGVQG